MIQTNLPSSTMFQRLLAAARAAPQPAPEAAADFDFTSPCRFTARQLTRLSEIAAAAARELERAVGDTLRLEMKLQLAPPQQQYAAAVRQGGAAGKYSLALTADDGKKYGWITLSPPTATAWVSRLLGGAAGGDGAERDLSSLEVALLLNVLTVAAKALSGALTKAGARPLRTGDAVVDAATQAGADDAAEFCRLIYHTGDAAKPALCLTLPADAAELLIDGPSKDPRKPADLRKDLVAHVGQVAVMAATQLGETRVPMKDVLALEEGDVLILDVQVGEAIPLLIQGQLVLAGVPVACDGHYGLQVTLPAGTLMKK